MKISKWVTFDQEVDVDVTAEDIETVLSESPDNERIVMTLISRFHSVMKITKDEIIEKIEIKNRAIIRNFLLELAERFKEPSNG